MLINLLMDFFSFRLLFYFLLVLSFPAPAYAINSILSRRKLTLFNADADIVQLFLFSLFLFSLWTILAFIFEMKAEFFANFWLAITLLSVTWLFFVSRKRLAFTLIYEDWALICIFVVIAFFSTSPFTGDILEIFFKAKNLVSLNFDIAYGLKRVGDEGFRFEIFAPLIVYFRQISKIDLFWCWFLLGGFIFYLSKKAWQSLLVELLPIQYKAFISAIAIALILYCVFAYNELMVIVQYESISGLIILFPLYLKNLLSLLSSSDESKKRYAALELSVVFFLAPLWHKAIFFHFVLLTPFVFVIFNLLDGAFFRRLKVQLKELLLLLIVSAFVFAGYFLFVYFYNQDASHFKVALAFILCSVLSCVIFWCAQIRKITYFESQLLQIFLPLIPPGLFMLFAHYGSNQYADDISAKGGSVAIKLFSENMIIFDPLGIRMLPTFIVLILSICIFKFSNNRNLKVFGGIVFSLQFGSLLVLLFPPLTTVLVNFVPLWAIDRIRIYFYPLSFILIFLVYIDQTGRFGKFSRGIFVTIIGLTLLYYHSSQGQYKYLVERVLSYQLPFETARSLRYREDVANFVNNGLDGYSNPGAGDLIVGNGDPVFESWAIYPHYAYQGRVRYLFDTQKIIKWLAEKMEIDPQVKYLYVNLNEDSGFFAKNIKLVDCDYRLDSVLATSTWRLLRVKKSVPFESGRVDCRR
jgi:hypothetical protein